METKYKIKTIQVQLKLKEGNGQPVTSPDRLVEVSRAIYSKLDADQEHFVLISLNTQNDINGFKVIASGAMDQVLVDPKILFRYAILFGSVGLSVIHNHPSGNPEPSEEDKRLTRTIKEAARLLDIRLLDHIIIAGDKYFSFLEKGLI